MGHIAILALVLSACHRHHHGRVADEGLRVVAPPCRRSIARPPLSACRLRQLITTNTNPITIILIFHNHNFTTFAQTVCLSQPEVNVLQAMSNFKDVTDFQSLERRQTDPLVGYRERKRANTTCTVLVPWAGHFQC